MNNQSPPPHTSKRRFKRCNHAVLAGTLVHGIFFIETTKQLSEGGLLLAVRRPMKVGDSLEITFVLEPGQFVQVNAEVVYVRTEQPGATEMHAGVRFVDPPMKTREAIRQFVEQSTSRPN